MKISNKVFALISVLIILLSLCACGNSRSAGAPAQNFSVSAAEDKMSAQAPMMEAAVEAGLSDNALVNGSAPDNSIAVNPEKIIYSADVSLETTSFDDTRAQISQLIKEYGGWIESAGVNGNNYYSQTRGYASHRSANYTIRIPSEKFDRVMGCFSSLGNVPYSNTYAQNVTANYYDTQARLNVFKAQEQRLLEMMDKADAVEDLIKIEAQLTEVRCKIESLQSSLNNWDRQVSYSTINLNVEEVSEFTPAADVSYSVKLVDALKRGFTGLGNFFANFLVILVTALPTLVLLAIIVLVVIVVLKSTSKKRKAKKAAKAEKAQLEEVTADTKE